MNTKTIGDYLLERLHAYGVRHVFGIPGDFVLTLWHQMHQSGLVVPVNTVDEQGSGFAADGYARLAGLGAVCQTYGVGGIKALHTAASSYAERVPVVVISGAPGLRERARGPILHHTVKTFDSQLKMFEEVTVATTLLDDTRTAFREIDRVLSAALHHKRPVYIEIPRDMFTAAGDPDHIPSVYRRPASNPDALRAALDSAVTMIESARQPVILAGVELQRYGLKEALRRLLEMTNLPFAATVLGKAVLSERHPNFLGVYQGSLGPETVQQAVENSDCLITLGMVITDVNLGLFTAKIDPQRDIFVNSERASVQGRNHESVRLEEFVEGLISRLSARAPVSISHPPAPVPFAPVAGRKITTGRLFEAVNAFLDEHHIVTADNGEPLIAGTDLLIPADEGFYAPGYYTSVGFSVPMAMGVQMARPDVRPVVLAGDAAFQMTGVELSTMARFNLNPIVIVMDNGGYGSERPVHDEPYVDTLRWDYAAFTTVLGKGQGFCVETEDQLAAALESARAYTESFVIIDVKLETFDYSPAFARFLQKFAEGVKKS